MRKSVYTAAYHQSRFGKLMALQVPPAPQVPNPNLAATFNGGGPLCASVCMVLGKA